MDSQHALVEQGSKVLTGSNPYPREPPGFKEAVEEYVGIMRHLGMAIMRGLAMGLGLSQSFFDDKMDNSFWVLRIIGYPPLDTQVARQDTEKGISCGEHTDYGTVAF